MPYSGVLRRVALVGTDVSEEVSVSIIRMTRIGELRTLAPTSNRRTLRPSSPILVTLMMETVSSSETLVLTRSTRRKISEDDIIHSRSRENLKFYKRLKFCQTN
jgi:hypothetical protein